MLKKQWLFLLILSFTLLSACGNEEENTESNVEELKQLLVDFAVPEEAEVNETIELTATVTYGDENVDDADEVTFEIWETGNEDDSIMIEPENNGDGTYTAETTFDEDGVYEMYAHVTARTMHTMPLESITVGEGTSEESEDDASLTGSDDETESEGFSMEFKKDDEINTEAETNLAVHLQMDGNPLEAADVRYEIWNDTISDKHNWVKAGESSAGEYHATYEFPKPGIYKVQIHVENDDGLHEHEVHDVEVN
ncbi:FixH family protein [Virgibacillus ainsalahensis]